MLPARRDGPLPEWPLTDQTMREAAIWEREWVRPQAVMWEANGQQIEVALYVRALREAESLEGTVAERTLVRQFMDSLGLTGSGLARLRWRIATTDDIAPKEKPASGTRRTSASARFAVIQGKATG